MLLMTPVASGVPPSFFDLPKVTISDAALLWFRGPGPIGHLGFCQNLEYVE
jgi:hypothetical protein